MCLKRKSPRGNGVCPHFSHPPKTATGSHSNGKGEMSILWIIAVPLPHTHHRSPFATTWRGRKMFCKVNVKRSCSRKKRRPSTITEVEKIKTNNFVQCWKTIRIIRTALKYKFFFKKRTAAMFITNTRYIRFVWSHVSVGGATFEDQRHRQHI